MRRSLDSSSTRLEQLIQGLEDGSLDSEQHQELMRLMRTDPDVRKEYLDYMNFISLLYSEAEAVAELEGKGNCVGEVSPQKQLLRSGLIAAAVIALGVWIAAFVIPEPPISAGVVGGPGAVWSFVSGGIDQETQRFIPGTSVALKTGTLDLRFSSGSQVVLEGPAELEVMGASELKVSSGRLWTRAESENFVVETRNLRVTDLGTEFGIMASENRDDEVHVGSGMVRVELLDGKNPILDLVTGEAVRISRIGRLRRVPYDSSKFQTELPSIPPFLHWSFDEIEDEQFLSKGSLLEGAPMEIFEVDQRDQPLGATSTAGRFGSALALEKDGLFARADFPGISGDLPRTVSFWVKFIQPPEEKEVNTLFSWGLASEQGTKWVMALGRGELSTGWGGDWAHSPIPNASSAVDDGEWHHVVQVFTGATREGGQPEIIHYFDGKGLELRSAGSTIQVDTDCSSKASWPFTFGAQLFQEVKSPTFIGAVDELYVFRCALSAEQIEILYKENALPFRNRVKKK